MSNRMVPLDEFQCRPSGDVDISLTCAVCGGRLCRVECGDTLESLLLQAIDHRCPPDKDLWS